MTTHAAIVDRTAAQAYFRDWQAEQATIDAQLSESLDALAAYQSQLDAWQRQLAEERDELRQARDQFERQRAAAEKTQAQPSPEIVAELGAARDKMATLTTSLLSRTEELRTLDNRRAELVTELELTRARERELKTTLDEQRLSLEQERAQWTEEMHQLREILARRIEETGSNGHENERGTQTAPDQPAARVGAPEQVKNNPVLGSIVEQFGKLRQQRATDRQAFRKAR